MQSGSEQKKTYLPTSFHILFLYGQSWTLQDVGHPAFLGCVTWPFLIVAKKLDSLP
jgi:hypothetical protein